MSASPMHTVVPFVCPACGHAGKVPVELAGRATLCPGCALPFAVPLPLADPPQTTPVEEIKATYRITFPAARRTE